MCITIDREHRDALWSDIVADLTGIGDLYLALRDGKWAKARELRARFEANMRLLDDIGWGQHDTAERFVLTVEPEELRRNIGRLHADAERFADSAMRESNIEAALRSLRIHSAILDLIPAEASRPASPDDA